LRVYRCGHARYYRIKRKTMFIHTSSKAPFAAVGETTPNESKEK